MGEEVCAGEVSNFFLPFHMKMALYLSFLSHGLKCSLYVFEITAVGMGRSLVSRLVHIHSWEVSFKISINFEPYEKFSWRSRESMTSGILSVIPTTTGYSLYYSVLL